jgi:hypothetical protein
VKNCCSSGLPDQQKQVIAVLKMLIQEVRGNCWFPDINCLLLWKDTTPAVKADLLSEYVLSGIYLLLELKGVKYLGWVEDRSFNLGFRYNICKEGYSILF